MALTGIALIVVVFFITPNFRIYVVGRDPLEIPGKGLEEIFTIIRQYRERVEVETYEKEPKKVTKTRKKTR